MVLVRPGRLYGGLATVTMSGAAVGHGNRELAVGMGCLVVGVGFGVLRWCP